jgi:predicted ATPase/DNA-binding SARP family transcriptional activator
MEFRILGPLEVVRHGVASSPGGPKHRALLALLLLHANQPVPQSVLFDGLWGDRPPQTAAKALQVYVSQLRRTLGRELVRTRPGGYELVIGPDALDLARFERLVAEARASSPADAAPKMREALALWRGTPLADVGEAAFAPAETGRLEELRLAASEELAEAELALGHEAELIPELERLVAQNPLRERLREQLMLALYRCGRQADALESYQQARRILVEQLGIDPGLRLRELETAILRQHSALDLVSAVEEGVEAPELPRGAFVGRQGELDQLLHGLSDAFAGRGRLFLLAGEPGIGKSRLAEEVARRAHARGARTLVGRCWEAGGAPAYWPWVQSLRGHIRSVEPAVLQAQLGGQAADLAQMLPELRELLPHVPEMASSADPESTRFRLFDATAQFLQRASESRPILLVLDDLHAADTPSLLLLQFVARELAASRVLIIASHRDVDPVPAPALAALLAEIAREPVTRRISLAGLSEREVAAYVELTAAKLASPQLATALHEQTEGNPLFFGETVQLLSLERTQLGSHGTQLAIPPSVRDVIQRRLTHLSETCNQLLVLASVLGREFAVHTLARVAGISESDLLETLDEAVEARVLSDVAAAPGRLRFAHVLIRDTIYEGLTTTRRVLLHRLAVEALDTYYGNHPGPHLAELAHHAIAGSDFERSLSYARRAGDRARALLAYEEAARLYESALDALALSGPDDQLRCELLLALGEAQSAAGNSVAAKEAFLDAAAIAERAALSHHLARAAVGYGGRMPWARASEVDRLVPLLEAGLAAIGNADVELRARLLARLAGALRNEHARERRDRLSSEAVAIARQAENDAALAFALDGRVGAIIAPDTIEECLELSSELCQVARRLGDTERLVAGHWNRYIAHVLLADMGEAGKDLAVAIRIADELKQPAELFQVRATQAMLALAEGRLPDAERLILAAFELGEQSVPEMAIPVLGLQQYALFDLRGRLADIDEPIRDLANEHGARPVFRCALALVCGRLGRTSEATRMLDELTAGDASSLPFDQEWLYGMSMLAETAALLQDEGSAAVLYNLLHPWAALNVVDHPEGLRGSVSRYLGLLATTQRRWNVAENHFEQAGAMNKRIGARPWLAHTQHDHARMLLTRDARGDREKAQRLLADAHATYRALTMETFAASAAATLVSAQTDPAASPPGGPLSHRRP